MPQMMPINWMLSFFFFIYIFVLFNMMNYYICNYNSSYKINNFKTSNKKFYWKW